MGKMEVMGWDRMEWGGMGLRMGGGEVSEASWKYGG